jgi:sec-independent protein translocase protein TatC
MKNDEKQLTFMGHLKELRSCLLRSVIAILVAIPISFYIAKYVFDILMKPVPGIHLIYTEVTEMLGTYAKVTLVIAVILTLPFIVYQLVMFVRPALTKRERSYVYIMLPAIAICFLIGATFAYFVLLPPALNFLFTFGSDIAEPMIKVGNYISVLTQLIFWIGMCFEIPIIIFFLSKIGVIRPAWLSKYRKIAYILAFVIGAIITPTIDPVNQSLVAVPIIALYEFGIILSKVARRKKEVPSSAKS